MIPPMLLPMPKAEGTMKSFSLQFLVDFHEHWLEHGKGVLDIFADRQPAAYLAGAVALAKVMRIELGKPGEFDRPKKPEEIIEKLEQRIGSKGREIFENFVREINRLQAEQQVEQQQQQQQEQERRRQRRQHHAVSPSGDAGSGGSRGRWP